MIIEDLTLIKSLGKSSFGEVFLSSKNGSSMKYITKVIDKASVNNTEAKKYLDNEISFLKDINHPNIVHLIELKDTEEKLYIVQDYCNGGELSKFLEKYREMNNKGLPEEVVQHIMRQLLSVMEYLSNKKIMHRDLKLDNIFINYEDENDKKNKNIMKATIKLNDFAFAKYLKKGELTHTTIGSPLYMSPIILNKLNEDPEYKNKGYDGKEDIWSLGNICYELLMGKSAFDSEDMEELHQKINKGDYYFPITVSKEIVSFINGMLQYDSSKRLSFDELKNHKFLKKNVNEFHKIESNKLKNLSDEDNAQLLLNTKNNKRCWIILEMEPKKIFEE